MITADKLEIEEVDATDDKCGVWMVIGVSKMRIIHAYCPKYPDCECEWWKLTGERA